VIAGEFDLPLIELDLQGMSQPLQGNSYLEFISKLAAQFKACYQ
jgi:ABC-type Zn2+ transport system substrate-binding protein/surface adhesin